MRGKSLYSNHVVSWHGKSSVRGPAMESRRQQGRVVVALWNGDCACGVGQLSW